MRRPVLAALMLPIFLFGVSLLAIAEQDKDKPKKSMVDGSWTTTKGEEKITLTFAADKFTMTKSKGGVTEDITGTFKVDAKAKPTAIDMSPTGGTSQQAEKYKGKTSLGIVKVEGNKLEWCANEPGREGRPKTFAEQDGDMKYLYMTFDRVKK